MGFGGHPRDCIPRIEFRHVEVPALVYGSGSSISVLGFRVQGSGFRFWVSELQFLFGIKVFGFLVSVSGFRFGYRVWVSGLGVMGKVSGLEFRV